MGFDDGFEFSTKWLGDRTKFKKTIAVLCECGEAKSQHTLKQLRECRKNEKNAA